MTQATDPVADISARLESLGRAALCEISNAADAGTLESLRVKFLGKKSEFSDLQKQLGKLDSELRPRIGKIFNETRQQLENAIAERRAVFAQEERNRKLSSESLDVTLPGRP